MDRNICHDTHREYFSIAHALKTHSFSIFQQVLLSKPYIATDEMILIFHGFHRCFGRLAVVVVMVIVMLSSEKVKEIEVSENSEK